MRKFRSVIPLAGAMAASMLLTACMDESPWGSTSKETGTIDITLTADYSFDTSKPVFQDDTRAKGDVNDITTYLSDGFVMPSVDKFSIRLTKADGTTDQIWGKLEDFQEAAKDGFAIGSYTLTAFYGDIEDASYQGFDSPCFSASTTFTVLPGRESKIELTPTLANSMVVFEYSDAFKEYMASYNAKLTPKNAPAQDRTEITFEQNETRAAFIQPLDADVKVSFTTKVTGKTQSASVEIGKFAPQPRTLHKIKFDIKENSNGFAQLTLTYDENLEESFVPIDLTDDLYSTPEPEVTVTSPTNFVNGKSYNILTGSSEISSFKMNVVAKGGISKAEVSVTKKGGTSSGWSDINMDIYGKSSAALQTLNLVGDGFDNTAESNVVASLDVSDLINSLPQDGSVYTLTFSVTDKKGQTCKIHDATGNILTDAEGNDYESVVVVLNAENITAALAEDEEGNSLSTANFCATEAYVTIDFTGNNPNGVSFEVETSPNHYESVTSSWVSGQKNIGTRAFESQQCSYKLSGLPAIKSENLNVRAIYNNSKIADLEIPVNLPEYSISDVDAFAHYAYLKVTTPKHEDLSNILDNLKIKANGTVQKPDVESYDTNNHDGYGIVCIKNLNVDSIASANFVTKTSITNGVVWNDGPSFTTESESTIPNGDFSQTTQTINKTKVESGGRYRYVVFYQPTANIVRSEPVGWASINSKTCWFDCSGAKNTWFQVPSTYAENGEVMIRNVAFDHNGTRPDDMSETVYWINTNVPNFASTCFAAGELFLGSYSYDSNGEHRTDGIKFSSRPASIQFDYKYSPTGNDNACVEVIVRNSSGIVGSTYTTLSASSNFTAKTIQLSNYKFGEKATKIEVRFRSSTEQYPMNFVHIPNTEEELSEGFGKYNFGDKNLGNNTYKAVATGSVLTIKNVEAVY